MRAQVKRTAHTTMLVLLGIATLAATTVGVTTLAGAESRLGPGPPPPKPTGSAACTVHHSSMVSWHHMPAEETELSTQWVSTRGPAIAGVQALKVQPQGHHSEKTPPGVNATYHYQAHFTTRVIPTGGFQLRGLAALPDGRLRVIHSPGPHPDSLISFVSRCLN
jgi:hypothetical protein